jgi:hypothetical protein
MVKFKAFYADYPSASPVYFIVAIVVNKANDMEASQDLSENEEQAANSD